MKSITFNRPTQGYVLDRTQGRYRIGLLALTNDLVVERDMMSMRPNDDEVHMFTARVPFEGNCEPSALAAMAGRLKGATDTILPGERLDAVIYSCTSGTAAIGVDAVTAAVQASRPNAAVITPISAAHAAFRALRLKHISLVTPYVDDVTAATLAALEEGGVRVVRVVSLGIASPEDISAVKPASIVEAAVEADDPRAEGMFISCTDFRAAQCIEQIEKIIEKPVVTANQATIWHTLCMLDYNKPIEGFGKLMRMP